MTYTLKLSEQELQLIWNALSEIPAKHVLPLMLNIKAQHEDQKRAEADTQPPG